MLGAFLTDLLTSEEAQDDRHVGLLKREGSCREGQLQDPGAEGVRFSIATEGNGTTLSNG
jgi:hypothetical protein